MARGRAAWLALPALALALACALHLLCLLRAPAAFYPARIDVRLTRGEALALGRGELAAPAAGAGQLGLRRDGAGRWWLSDRGGSRPLLVERGDTLRPAGSIVPSAGLRFQAGAKTFTVTDAGARQLSFSDGSRRWHYDGATLLRDGMPQPPCPGERIAARLAAAWNHRVPTALSLARPLTFGGNLACANRLGIAGLAPGGAVIARSHGRLLLLAPAGPGQAPLMVTAGGALPADLSRREEPLDGVTALVAGRTRLSVSLERGLLVLRPESHVGLAPGREAALPPQVAWRWRARDPWALPEPGAWLAALGAGALGALALLLANRRTVRGAVRSHRAGGALLIAAGGAALLLQRAGAAPGFGISMLLAWSALWHTLLAPRRAGLVTVAGVLLLAVGLLFQLELGLAAMESSWIAHFQKTAALLAVGLGAGNCVRLSGMRLGQAAAERLLLVLAAAALAALALQVAFGDETGVFGLQPVELAKLALAALAAHCMALAIDAGATAPAAPRRWLRLAAPALLFLALLGLALVQVDDYSPLILLLVWSGAMLLAWTLATRRRLVAAALAGLACVAVLCIGGLRGAGAAEVAHLGFYPDRFLVWLDPLAHPHTGQQLLLAARAIAGGGWHGVDGMFGLASLGQPGGDALRIPEVADDFAPAFFLNRHGLAAGLALWALQALFVAALLRAARTDWAAGGQARGFRHAWLARLRCFALCGGAAFVAGHLLLSWGTNLAILPVMGQPMSFLSAGGSHLLFFICPLLAAGSAGVQSFEENHHAGLRPT